MQAQPAALVPSTLSIGGGGGGGGGGHPTPDGGIAAAPPGPPAGVGIPGCCGGPSYHKPQPRDCNTDGRGEWDAKTHGIVSLEGCIAKALPCKMAHFASFYPASGTDDGKCSWHLSCAGWPMNIATCSSVLTNYTTARINDVPPPPPPPPSPPPSPSPCACQAWVNGGSCDTSSGAQRLGSPHAEPAMIAASVSVATTGGLQAKLMNYGARNVTLTVLLGSSASTATEGTVSWMAADSPDAVNSFDEPRHVSLQTKPVSIVGGTVTLQLPPWSVSVLTVETAGRLN